MATVFVKKMTMKEGCAVIVKDAYKRYGPKTVILNGLNMTVAEGTIYGLLGPSGCGKTTLLSSIVGMRTLDFGTIELAVKHKVEVGYMPQEIALNTEFTIREVLHFYGRIYQFPISKVEKVGQELLNFLELPPMDRRIGNCSGGQQRRISMAVTLLHDPKLLILDEPTVGVDPLLSNSIWEHFLDIVATKGKTIIITTHYIEEAKNANMIGLMRNGVLLAEQPPGFLMERYQCDSLEEVFLKLSEKQEGENEPDKPFPKSQPNDLPLKSEENFNAKRFKAQVIKNFNWTRRNLPVTAFVVCLPAILFTIIGQISSKEGGDYPVSPKPLAIVNEEADCRNSTPFLLLSPNCKLTRPFSCRVIERLDETFPLVSADSVLEGKHAVRTGYAVGVLHFGTNFSVDLMARVKDATSLSNEKINSSSIHAWLDMSDYGCTVRTMRELREGIVKITKDFSEECGYNRKVAAVPMDFSEPIHKSRDLMQAILPSYFCSVSFYTTTMFTSSAIVMERASGLFERSQVAGLTIMEILVAQMVIQMFVMTLQNILSFLVLYGIFSYPMNGSFALAFFIINMNELDGMAYGFLLSMLIKEEKNVAYAGIFTVLSLFMLTGTVWPTQALHWAMVPLSKMIPATHTSEAYFDVAMRGLSISYYSVYIGIFASLMAIVLFGTFSYLAFRLKIGSI
ncbi:ABC transporter G family member 20-like isoform X2 [Rhodnius prolixus]|uniref:ABC transporter G family member 20-like isoform X2 n=1 Tax=Rhodnius prolixus TaxID=13249 RepID=UPI003D18A738